MPPTSRGLEEASPPSCSQTSILPTAQRAPGNSCHSEVTPWDWETCSHSIYTGLGFGEQGATRSSRALVRTPAPRVAKRGTALEKWGTFLGVQGLTCPAPQFGQGTTAAWPYSWELSPRQHGLGSSLQGLSKQPCTPKNPGGDVRGGGVTPEGCCKFSIYRDGGWGSSGWSPAIFYSRCIPKILVKCNIKL